METTTLQNSIMKRGEIITIQEQAEQVDITISKNQALQIYYTLYI